MTAPGEHPGPAGLEDDDEDAYEEGCPDCGQDTVEQPDDDDDEASAYCRECGWTAA